MSASHGLKPDPEKHKESQKLGSGWKQEQEL